MNTTTSDFTTALSTFLARWQERVNEHYRLNLTNLTPPTLKVMKGRKFARIVAVEKSGSSRSMGFVALVDGMVQGERVLKGDILMSATWHAPAKHSRGTIFASDNGMSAVNVWGVNYLK